MKAYILIGPAGCGKSTEAKRLLSENKNLKYLSSDAVRGEINGDEADQSNPEKVWGEIRRRFQNYLKNGDDVLFDATNYNKKSRKDFGQWAYSYGYEVIAVDCFTGLDAEEVYSRNLARMRVVPLDVVAKMIAGFQIPTVEEGFSSVITVNQK